MTAPAEPTTTKRRASKKGGTKTRARADFNEIVVNGVSEAPGAFTTGLANDHPVVEAFGQSYESAKSLRFDTDTPELVVKALRKIANDRGLSVSTKIDEEGGVVFLARDKRERKSKGE